MFKLNSKKVNKVILANTRQKAEKSFTIYIDVIDVIL